MYPVPMRAKFWVKKRINRETAINKRKPVCAAKQREEKQLEVIHCYLRRIER